MTFVTSSAGPPRATRNLLVRRRTPRGLGVQARYRALKLGRRLPAPVPPDKLRGTREQPLRLLLEELPCALHMRLAGVQVPDCNADRISIVQAGMRDEDLSARVHRVDDGSVQCVDRVRARVRMPHRTKAHDAERNGGEPFEPWIAIDP